MEIKAESKQQKLARTSRNSWAQLVGATKKTEKLAKIKSWSKGESAASSFLASSTWISFSKELLKRYSIDVQH
jgi:hypothetical protein